MGAAIGRLRNRARSANVVLVMQNERRTARTRPALLIVAAAVATLAACASSGAASPAGSAAPSGAAAPTVASAEDAAALVVASDPRFEGAVALDPQMIGLSKWWEASANDDGSYTVKVTLGWGDCPAGCINRHTWSYRVGRDRELTLLEESGSPVPASLAP
jgi:hypothetical protein